MNNKGFSLIELLVTLALIALLATIALPMTELSVKRSQEVELRTALRQIREAIYAYKQAADEGRVIMSPGDSGYPKTLAVLVSGVEDSKSPGHVKIYFVRRIPHDPFADPKLTAEDSWFKRSYKSSYDHPEYSDDIYDVSSSSRETGINGIPYKEW